MYNNYFNLSSTYSWDSDIPMNDQRRYVIDEKRFNALANKNFAEKKRSDVPVAWFVSLCPTQSKREDYVKRLQRFINVDVYGDCGNLTCDKGTERYRDDECVNNLLDGKGSYKFYLAFENSLCEDYVTEKLWKIMKTNVVPIVMGAVSYGAMLPKDSFIDVRDFENPKSLAQFLLHLNANDEEYNHYLRTKASLKIVDFSHGPRECVFCKGVHQLRKRVSVVYAVRTRCFLECTKMYKTRDLLQK